MKYRVTFSSGQNETQVDYILVPMGEKNKIRNCKVVETEECVKQHRLVVVYWKLKPIKKVRTLKVERVKLWRLKDRQIQDQYAVGIHNQLTMQDREGDVESRWDIFKNALLQTAKTVCGISKGSNGRDRKPWMWSAAVKNAVTEKKDRFRKWKYSAKEDDKQQYKEARKQTKKVVAMELNKNREEWIGKIETGGKNAKLFRIAQNITSSRQDVGKMKQITGTDGQLVTSEDEVLTVWTDYMSRLLNEGSNGNGEGDEQEEEVMVADVNISSAEVEVAVRSMKNGKAAGKSGVVTEMLKAMGKTGITFLTELFNEICKTACTPNDWKIGIIIPVYKGKGNPMECNSYRPIKLMEHSMKVFKRVLEQRLRKTVKIDGMQNEFMPGRSTTDALYAVRTMVEKHLEKRRDLWAAFVDVEKAYDRLPRKMVWWALKQQGVDEKTIRVIQILYESSRAMVRIGTTNGVKYGKEFEVKIGVHQGSVLSPLLFITVMEEVSKKVRRGIPWEALFADDLAVLATEKEELLEHLEKWNQALGEAGMKINIDKTKVMKFSKDTVGHAETGKFPCGVCGKGVGANSILCTKCNKWIHGKCSGLLKGTMGVAKQFTCKSCSGDSIGIGAKAKDKEGGEYEVVNQFCYLGNMLEANGGVAAAVRARIQKAWANWKKMAPLLQLRQLSYKIKGWIYRVVVRSTMMYGMETWPMTKETMYRLECTQMRMLRWMAGISRAERRTNASIREAFWVEAIEKVARQMRLNGMDIILKDVPKIIHYPAKVLKAPFSFLSS